MSEELKKMKPIWYFVGLMLLSMGTIITLSGLYFYFNPPEVKTVLAELHASLWWGMVMVVSGAIFFLFNRSATVK
jgi:hypothetical protein